MKTLIASFLMIYAGSLCCGQDRIARGFSGMYGQVEVGGPYAGAEFHGSRPLPSRISFYEPAANSIDMSTDYWKRGESAPFIVGVCVNRGVRQNVGGEPWAYTLSPHRVSFHREDSALRWTSTYEFLKGYPGLVWTLTCQNVAPEAVDIELYVQCRPVLRTCQTYAWLDSAWTEAEPGGRLIAVHFDQPQTRGATVVIENLGEQPAVWTSEAADLGPDPQKPGWFTSAWAVLGRTITRGRQGRPVAAFMYKKNLAASARATVRLGMVTTEITRWKKTASALRTNWASDVRAYDAHVRNELARAPRTGDRSIDMSADWACALLASNAHSLEGHVVPMPCPAEYNFFFTHDVLLTDLSAVWFDAPRVRRDLATVAGWAQGDVIPHARYWRDDGFKTELCTPDYWNLLWFIETVSRYLHHTSDTATVARLFPLVRKSLEQVLTQCRSDSLMYAFRPDWWDIGRREGPRSYITVLTIRALRDYLFLCSFMRRDLAALAGYELLADGMERALTHRLWDSKTGYLMNANGSDPDAHFYMGSLMGAVYGELPPDTALVLLATAERVLLDKQIGVRNVMPPDFHKDSVRAYYRFPSNEAGNPYFYANGGVWPHANAWYAQGLIAAGRMDDALRFFRTVMTLDGVSASPRGQPAFYEYRYADTSSAEYGAIDKPSFLWAGGMYLGTLYSLMGFRETEWNIGSGDGRSSGVFRSASARLEFGASRPVRVIGTGAHSVSLSAGSLLVPSGVFPIDCMKTSPWTIRRDEPGGAYLAGVNAILRSCRAVKRGGLRAVISSFDGHVVRARVVSRATPSGAFIDGRRIENMRYEHAPDGAVVTTLAFPGTLRSQVLEIKYY